RSPLQSDRDGNSRPTSGRDRGDSLRLDGGEGVARRAHSGRVRAARNERWNEAMTRYGLSNDAAQARLRQYGPNSLPERPPTPLWRRFARQFQSPLIYILLFALVADAAIWVSEGAMGAPVESIAIAVILLLNAGLGVYQESKSEAALARLKEMAAPMVWVMREGRLLHLPTAAFVLAAVTR